MGKKLRKNSTDLIYMNEREEEKRRNTNKTRARAHKKKHQQYNVIKILANAAMAHIPFPFSFPPLKIGVSVIFTKCVSRNKEQEKLCKNERYTPWMSGENVHRGILTTLQLRESAVRNDVN
jgi:hypothetical protein